MTMLDETTCPVCGKGLDDDVASDWVEYGSVGTQDGRILSNSIWAVAHYLAHLVQHQADQQRRADEAIVDGQKRVSEMLEHGANVLRHQREVNRRYME